MIGYESKVDITFLDAHHRCDVKTRNQECISPRTAEVLFSNSESTSSISLTSHKFKTRLCAQMSQLLPTFTFSYTYSCFLCCVCYRVGWALFLCCVFVQPKSKTLSIIRWSRNYSGICVLGSWVSHQKIWVEGKCVTDCLLHDPEHRHNLPRLNYQGNPGSTQHPVLPHQVPLLLHKDPPNDSKVFK